MRERRVRPGFDFGDLEMAHCARCDVNLEDVGMGQGFQPIDGLSFVTHDHYGSTYFDPTDGTYLEIVICDSCVSVLEKSGQVYRSDAPCTQHD